MSEKSPDPAAARFVGFENLPLSIHVKVGEARCRVGTLAELAPGELIALDRRIGEPFELRAGRVLLGRVEPVAQHDAVAIKLVDVPEDDDASGR